MLYLRLAGQLLELLPGTTLSVEYNSPVFDEEVLRGAFSYAFTLPLSPANRHVLGYPDIIENAADVRRTFEGCELEDSGLPLGQNGKLLIRSVQPNQVQVNVAFGLSAAAAGLRDRKLASFALGGERTVQILVQSNNLYVPGITFHANDVVKNPDQYDYVFAPIRNHVSEKEATDSELAVAPLMLNPWFWYHEALFGIGQTQGTFVYRVGFSIPGLPTDDSPIAFAPFPKVSYLIRAIFQELGFPLASDCFAGELGQLVVLHGNIVTASFQLAQLLPNLTAKEFLLKLRQTLGIIVDLTPAGELIVPTLEDILTSTEYDDWTDLAAPGFTSRDVQEVKGTTLTYHVASNDKQAADFFQGPPVNLPVGDPVATVADLPATDVSYQANLPRDEVRLVTTLDVYYRRQTTIDGAAGTVKSEWLPAGSSFVPVPVAGGGDDAPQGIAGTAMLPAVIQNIYGYDEYALLPSITETPYVAGAADDTRASELRLAFYRGLQPYQQNAGRTYPMVTPFAQNANGEQVGEHSLQLHGETGTVAKLLGKWWRLMATATPVKHDFFLSAEHLARLRMTRKIRVQGNMYLVKKIAVQVPLSKAATVELVPLPY